MIGRFIHALLLGTGFISWLVFGCAFCRVLRVTVREARKTRAEQRQAAAGIADIEALLREGAE